MFDPLHLDDEERAEIGHVAEIALSFIWLVIGYLPYTNIPISRTYAAFSYGWGRAARAS